MAGQGASLTGLAGMVLARPQAGRPGRVPHDPFLGRSSPQPAVAQPEICHTQSVRWVPAEFGMDASRVLGGCRQPCRPSLNRAAGSSHARLSRVGPVLGRCGPSAGTQTSIRTVLLLQSWPTGAASTLLRTTVRSCGAYADCKPKVEQNGMGWWEGLGGGPPSGPCAAPLGRSAAWTHSACRAGSAGWLCKLASPARRPRRPHT